MSVKIYNGFIYQPANFDSLSRQELIDMPFTASQAVRRPLDQAFYKRLKPVVGKLLDLSQGSTFDDLDAVPSWVDLPETPLPDDGYMRFRALWDLMEQLDRGDRRTCADIDLFWHVSLIPSGKLGSVLGIVYSEQAESYMRSLTIGGVKHGIRSYGWWDNTDKPSGATNAEWRERGQAWRRLLDGPAVPGRIGVLITVNVRSDEACVRAFAWTARQDHKIKCLTV